MLRAHPLEHRHAAAPVAPEVEVGADDHEARLRAVDEHLTNEVLRRLAAARLVEVQDEARVEVARRVEELELLLGVGEERRRGLRAHDLGGVAIEGDADGIHLPRDREVTDEPQHRAVPEVHAVVHPDGDDTARRRHRGELGQLVDDPHASTTAGFTAPPRRS